ncbi:hypothetical protein F5B22DRAFT_641248 [Xylaria bambusicola]|uniref:uncharacterized protein n=1 Tax=Xylaria bambusicola TaxID=326684 RepID=UPI002008E1CE|nr:uncharacterized protein F5B22DRAFT_641248 [Xylaria bambusicola]KAI0528276.1 hypothetical protein F5B22DRAFT_641248 [Xylaria bambusicola]
MPSSSSHANNGTPASYVETNNFHEIIRHFDDSGKLKNRGTRMKIECQICQCNDLAILSGENDQADTLGEKYTVLPGCGHGFGSHCLWEWIKIRLPYNAQCPSCRTPIDLNVTLPTFYNRHKDPAEQRKHITKIQIILTEIILTEIILTEIILTEIILTEIIRIESIRTESILTEILRIESVLMERVRTGKGRHRTTFGECFPTQATPDHPSGKDTRHAQCD